MLAQSKNTDLFPDSLRLIKFEFINVRTAKNQSHFSRYKPFILYIADPKKL